MASREYAGLWLKILTLRRRVAFLEGGGGSGVTALTGDVTASGSGSVAATIAADAVTNTKLANMAQATIKGRAAGAGTGDPTDLSVAQVKTILGIGVWGGGWVIDGRGSIIPPGLYKIPWYIDVPLTITKCRMFADVACDAECDIFFDPYASYPPTTSIVAADPPTLTTADSSLDSSLSGWTTALAVGDVGFVEVVANDLATVLTVRLEGTW